MTRTLVTGGSGFIAAHIVDVLLKRGHSVVTTVRSADKGDKILEYHSGIDKSRLSYAVVPDISQPGGRQTVR
jgi:nucleoside-diphosphate-sugar epimerase